jgi:hypothetical protein
MMLQEKELLMVTMMFYIYSFIPLFKDNPHVKDLQQ